MFGRFRPFARREGALQEVNTIEFPNLLRSRLGGVVTLVAFVLLQGENDSYRTVYVDT